MFTEKTEVGFISWSPVEEEELVLFDNLGSEVLPGLAGDLLCGGRGKAHRFAQSGGEDGVAFLGVVQAVVGEAAVASLHFTEEVGEVNFADRGELGNGRSEIVRLVAKNFRCDDCQAHRKPKSEKTICCTKTLSFAIM